MPELGTFWNLRPFSISSIGCSGVDGIPVEPGLRSKNSISRCSDEAWCISAVQTIGLEELFLSITSLCSEVNESKFMEYVLIQNRKGFCSVYTVQITGTFPFACLLGSSLTAHIGSATGDWSSLLSPGIAMLQIS